MPTLNDKRLRTTAHCSDIMMTSKAFCLPGQWALLWILDNLHEQEWRGTTVLTQVWKADSTTVWTADLTQVWTTVLVICSFNFEMGALRMRY